VKRSSRMYAGAGGVLLLSSVALTGSLVSTSAAAGSAAEAVNLRVDLDHMNNSGVLGRAQLVSLGGRLNVQIDARGFLKGMPHAQHIHFGAQARHECPNVAMDDRNNDHRLNTVDGNPAYGQIRKSLTTRGDASPASALAIDRFPTTPRGVMHYDRTIKVKGDNLRQGIRNGDAVLVIHGLDYNGNGKYDFRGAGKSELDPAFPAEATDPAACGRIRVTH